MVFIIASAPFAQPTLRNFSGQQRRNSTPKARSTHRSRSLLKPVPTNELAALATSRQGLASPPDMGKPAFPQGTAPRQLATRKTKVKTRHSETAYYKASSNGDPCPTRPASCPVRMHQRATSLQSVASLQSIATKHEARSTKHEARSAAERAHPRPHGLNHKHIHRPALRILQRTLYRDTLQRGDVHQPRSPHTHCALSL